MVAPSRITLARKRRALTLAELATLVGVSMQSLSNYENGRQVPQPSTLRRLADAVRFPAAFFTGPELDALPLATVSFRAPSKISARPREASLAAGRLAAEMSAWIDNRFRLPAPDLPSLGKPDPETAAGMVRARWGLGETPVTNMVHTLEAHGVRVFAVAAEHGHIGPYSFWHDGTPFVFLNTVKTAERCRFDAAHELGHLTMHGESKPVTGPRAEQEADDFAAAFLMPRASIIGHLPNTVLLDQIQQARHIWKVAALTLTYRLHDLGMISDWRYRTVCVELGRRGHRRDYGTIPPETSQVLGKVFRALRAKHIRPTAIAHDLNIAAAELNSLIHGLTVTALDGGTSHPTNGTRPPLRLIPAHRAAR